MLCRLVYKLLFLVISVIVGCLVNSLGNGDVKIKLFHTPGNVVLSGAIREVSGKAIAIYDGDTFKLRLTDGSILNIRIYGIDAPEKKQYFGKVSQRKLEDLIDNKHVTLKIYSEDKYGRKVSRVIVDDMDVGGEMLKSGLAWHYKQYSNDIDYAQLEDEARKNRLGLWKQGRPVPPWDWRKADK